MEDSEPKILFVKSKMEDRGAEDANNVAKFDLSEIPARGCFE
jgi:hypothetical protein